MRDAKILGVNVSGDEADWVKHAAKLRHESVQQFIKEAINARLKLHGVDAVLLKLKDDPPRRSRDRAVKACPREDATR